MVAILTADLINSAAYDTEVWMGVLKTSLSAWGDTPQDWEIYRGDELQLRTDPHLALQAAIELKARIKCIKGLDIRIAIGIGEEHYRGEGISESNGTAYQRSGRTLDQLKYKKKRMGIDTGDPKFDRTMNLILDLASDTTDSWSQVSAEMVAFALSRPNIAQVEMAEELRIQQSAVSQRQKRARLSRILDVLDYYQETIKELETK